MRGMKKPTPWPTLAGTRPFPPNSRIARKTAWPTGHSVADGITLELSRRGRHWLVSRLLSY